MMSFFRIIHVTNFSGDASCVQDPCICVQNMVAIMSKLLSKVVIFFRNRVDWWEVFRSEKEIKANGQE